MAVSFSGTDGGWGAGGYSGYGGGGYYNSYYQAAYQAFQQNQQLDDQLVGQMMRLSDEMMGFQRELRSEWEHTFVPELNQLIQDANSYASAARMQLEMGKAESEVGQAFDAQRQNALADLQSYGIDPSSGRYASLDKAMRTQEAAAQAGAGNVAEQQTEAIGRGLRSEALQASANLPGYATSAAGVAAGALKFPPGLGYPPQRPPFTPPNPHPQAGQATSYGPQGGPTLGGVGPMKKDQPEKEPHDQGVGRPPSLGGMPNPSGGGKAPGNQQPEFGGGQGALPGGPGKITSLGTDAKKYPSNLGTDQQQTDQTWGTPPNVGTEQEQTDQTWGTDPTTDPNSLDNALGQNDIGNWPNQPQDNSYDTSQDYQPNVGEQSQDNSPDSSENYSNSWNGSSVDNTNNNSDNTDWNAQQDSGTDTSEDFAGGGAIPMSASPSRGRRTDDIPGKVNQTGENIRVNAGEYIIPRYTVAWKGQEYFHKLIQQSKKARAKHGR